MIMIDSLTTHHGQVIIHRIDSIKAIEPQENKGEALVILHSGNRVYELARFYNRNHLGTPDLKAERIKSPEYPLHWAVEFMGYLEEEMAHLEYRGRFFSDQILDRFVYDNKKKLQDCGIFVKGGDD